MLAAANGFVLLARVLPFLALRLGDDLPVWMLPLVGLGGILTSLFGMVIGDVPSRLIVSDADPGTIGMMAGMAQFPVWGNLILLGSLLALRFILRRAPITSFSVAIGLFVLSYISFAVLKLPAFSSTRSMLMIVFACRLGMVLACAHGIWSVGKARSGRV